MTVSFTLYFKGFDSSEALLITIDKKNTFTITPSTDATTPLDCDRTYSPYDFSESFSHVNPKVDIEFKIVSDVVSSTAKYGLKDFSLCSAYGVTAGADPRCGADKWECADSGLAENEYFYNH